jgi:hypothetical protein
LAVRVTFKPAVAVDGAVTPVRVAAWVMVMASAREVLVL